MLILHSLSHQVQIFEFLAILNRSEKENHKIVSLDTYLIVLRVECALKKKLNDIYDIAMLI